MGINLNIVEYKDTKYGAFTAKEGRINLNIVEYKDTSKTF